MLYIYYTFTTHLLHLYYTFATRSLHTCTAYTTPLLVRRLKESEHTLGGAICRPTPPKPPLPRKHTLDVVDPSSLDADAFGNLVQHKMKLSALGVRVRAPLTPKVWNSPMTSFYFFISDGHGGIVGWAPVEEPLRYSLDL
jgi:hypothetical protein